jgi:hypothetical protein
VLGLEFGTTPIPAGRRESFLKGGPLFGTPTNTFLPALGKKSVRYVAFLASIPPRFASLSDVQTNGHEILLLRDLPHFRCRVKLRLKHPKAALALSEARNLPDHTSAA